MIDNLEERRTHGHQVLREIFGEKWQEAYAAGLSSNGFNGEAGRMAREFGFAENWDRPGLDRRSINLVVIGALIAQGKRDELKNHIRAGLINGITVEELELLIPQIIPYCGFPAASQALEAAAFVLQERGLTLETAKDCRNL